MRIVIVEPDGHGGLAHFAFQLANAMADQGADVTLLTSRHYELAHLPHRCHLDASLRLWPNIGQDPDWVSRAPFTVRVLRHRLRRVPRAGRMLLVWAGLAWRLARERPDAVQFSAIRFPVLAAFLWWLRRRQLTLTQVCHEFVPRDRGRLARMVGGRSTCAVHAAFSLMFFLGEGVRQAFLQACGSAATVTRVIPQGDFALFVAADDGREDMRQDYGLQPDDPVVLMFGGLRPSKGIEDLIDAFAMTRAQVPRGRLLIVGVPQAGVDPASYSARAAALGIDDAICIDAAYVPIGRVGALVRTADVVALPYRTATWSGVAQVAQAFGRPPVVTDVGSLAEEVEDQRTGIVVPAGDRAALAGALTALLADRETSRRLGAAAAARARARDAWSDVARAVLEATTEAIARDRKAWSA